MNIKSTQRSWLRAAAVALAALVAVPLLQAANITYDGINYTTASGGKATVAKYTIIRATADTPADTLFYTGDIVIPETFEYEGNTYTVVGTAPNSFVDCRDLTSVQLPATCVTIGRNSFKGCTSLTASPIPTTATTIGTGVFKGCSSLSEVTVYPGWTKIISEEFAGCPLKRLIFADTDAPVELKIDMFGMTAEDRIAIGTLEEIYIGRQTDASKYTNAQQPFHNLSALKKLTFAGGINTIQSTTFQGCTALDEVIFAEGNQVSSIGTSAFASCTSLPSIAIPDAVTTIEQSTFNGCRSLTSVTMGNDVTSIGITAFYNTGLTTITLPEALTSIGQSAFQKCLLACDLVLPAGVKNIGSQAFAETQITSVAIPAGTTSIGSAAFAPIATLAAITADGNENFKVENGILQTTDGKRILAIAAMAQDLPATIELPNVETIDNYGLYAAPFTTIGMPALKTIGNFGLANAGIETFTLNQNVTVGQNVFNGSALKSIIIAEGRHEIPTGLCANCTELASVSLPTSTTNIMMNAFANCPQLESMELPANVNYMESGAVPSDIKALRVLNPNPAALAAGVYSASQSDVECKVAVASVDKFKAASQWQYLNIVGDASIEAGSAALGCPTGLYFATSDGKLMYKDENGDIIDTEFNAGQHAFTLQSYKNRIYVAVAGQRFTYQDPNQPLGDGELFYVNNTNGIFYRVGVLNNVGYAPSEDPFTMYIDEQSNKIYISDRNVGIHEMDADTTGLYGSQPFLLQNQWLPYYNDEISWGSITGGFTLDSNGIFWMSKKFNGLCLLRFTRGDIYPTGGQGKTKHYNALFKDAIIKTFYLDEAHGYLYMQVQTNPNGCVPGIYRIALDKIQNADGSDKDNNADLTIADCQLIDDSPILSDGNEDSGELASIAQITSDGENIYWGYIAPETDDQAIRNSVPLDPENPLHKSGIKCIKADAESPVVQYAVENVKAYGIAGATYVPDQPEPSLKGDVNGDGNVDIADVNIVINIMLGKTELIDAADTNNDGNVDIADVNIIINIMLGK